MSEAKAAAVGEGPLLLLSKDEIEYILLEWLILLEEQDFDSIELIHNVDDDGIDEYEKKTITTTRRTKFNYDYLWDKIAEKHNNMQRISNSKIRRSGFELKKHFENDDEVSYYEYQDRMMMHKYEYDLPQDENNSNHNNLRHTMIRVRDASSLEQSDLYQDKDDDDDDDENEDNEDDSIIMNDDEEVNYKKCGLVLPVAQIQRQLVEHFSHSSYDDDDTAMESTTTMEVEPSASVMLTSIAEYMVAEVLELAGNEARTYCRKNIDSMDICYATSNDDGLSRCFFDPEEEYNDETLNEENDVVGTTAATTEEQQQDQPRRRKVLFKKIRPIIPPNLLPSNNNGTSTRIDVYWRATNRFPGGNCDMFTIRYRLIFENNDNELLSRVHRIVWRNYDGQQTIESGDVTTTTKSERTAKILSTLEDYNWKNALIQLFQSLSSTNRTDGSFYRIVDEKSIDNNAYDTEWSSTEVLVYNDDDDDNYTNTNPFLRLCRYAVMGSQYLPKQYQYSDDNMMKGTKEQRDIMEMMTNAIGIGKPQEFSEGKCSASKDRGITHTLPTGIPYAVYPEYFLY